MIRQLRTMRRKSSGPGSAYGHESGAVSALLSVLKLIDPQRAERVRREA